MKTLLQQAEITGLNISNKSGNSKLKVTLEADLREDTFAELAGMMKHPWVMVWFEGLQGQLMPEAAAPAFEPFSGTGDNGELVTVNTKTGEVAE